MGANSTEAIETLFRSYLRRCTVVGNRIVTPDELDITAGGHRLLDDPKAQDMDLERPDWKRGQ
jgi:hypothetical protein